MMQPIEIRRPYNLSFCFDALHLGIIYKWVISIHCERSHSECKWNKWGFRPPLWTCRLNWARGTWGWWDDTALQTQNSKWVSEAPHNIKYLRVRGGRNILFLWTWMPERGLNPRSPNFQAGTFSHCTRTPVLTVNENMMKVRSMYKS